MASLYGYYDGAIIESRDDFIEICEGSYLTQFTAHRVSDFSTPFFHWRNEHMNLRQLHAEIQRRSQRWRKETLEDIEVLHMLKMIEARALRWNRIANMGTLEQ